MACLLVLDHCLNEGNILHLICWFPCLCPCCGRLLPIWHCIKYPARVLHTALLPPSHWEMKAYMLQRHNKCFRLLLLMERKWRELSSDETEERNLQESVSSLRTGPVWYHTNSLQSFVGRVRSPRSSQSGKKNTNNTQVMSGQIALFWLILCLMQERVLSNLPKHWGLRNSFYSQDTQLIRTSRHVVQQNEESSLTFEVPMSWL